MLEIASHATGTTTTVDATAYANQYRMWTSIANESKFGVVGEVLSCFCPVLCKMFYKRAPSYSCE
jgi:hypothetical protein